MSNVTWMDDATTVPDVIEGAINATNGYFIIGTMITTFIVIFTALRARGYEMDSIFIYCGVFEFLITVFSIANSYIDFYWIMFPVALLFAGIMIRLTG